VRTHHESYSFLHSKGSRAHFLLHPFDTHECRQSLLLLHSSFQIVAPNHSPCLTHEMVYHVQTAVSLTGSGTTAQWPHMEFLPEGLSWCGNAHTRTHTHTHSHSHIHPHPHKYACSHTHIHPHPHPHAHTHIHTDTNTHTHKLLTHPHTHLRAHTHTHTHTRTRTHTHIHTHTRSISSLARI
jgi:hypothetical protein